MNINVLRDHLPEEVFSEIDELVKYFHLYRPIRLAHFLAQVAHESGGFRWKVENLNYSKEALMSVFRKYFPTESKAAQYARKPEEIANLVYANRMGNGDEASGDGWKYRGRGYIQLTGKYNYQKFQQHMESAVNGYSDNVIDNPELIADKYPMMSAAWFWDSNHLNELADLNANEEMVKRITKKINGGYNGLDDRLSKFNKFYNILI